MADDAVIVGAGPAGSALALRLARAGLGVRMIERKRFPRAKACGEYLSPGAVQELAKLDLAGKALRTSVPIRGVRLYGPRGDPLELPFVDAHAVAVERRLLDASLLEAARDAGAVVEHAHASDVIFEEGRAIGVRTCDPSGASAERRARWVLGADGLGSVVAQRLGLVDPIDAKRERFALGGHVPISAGDWLSMFSAEDAYYAVNPLGDGRANVMLVVPRRELAAWGGRIDEEAPRRIARIVAGRASVEAFPELGQRLAIGPLRRRVRAVHAPGALLVGDAAGFLSPFTGQGIWLALESARDAAAALLDVARGARSEPEAWLEYARKRRASWIPRRMLSAFVELLQRHDALALRALDRARRRRRAAERILAACAGVLPARTALDPLLLGTLLA